MSTDTALAVRFGIGLVVPAGFLLWQGWRRRRDRRAAAGIAGRLGVPVSAVKSLGGGLYGVRHGGRCYIAEEPRT